jgi:hypothetical protein
MGGRLGGRRGHSAAIAFVGGVALSSHGAKADIAKFGELREKLRTAKDAYWAEQVDIQWQVATAWALYAEGKYEDAPKRYERRCRCRGQD